MNLKERLRKLNKKLRRILIVVVIAMGVIIPVVWFLNSNNEAEAGWFDDGWNYRVTYRVNNTGGAVTNQKVKFDIDTAALISAGKIQSDCGDSRFTNYDGSVLRYYIDSAGGACNTNSTDYYILLPTINGGSAANPGVTQVLHYYGNPTAINGTETGQFTETTFSPSSTGSNSEETAEGPALFWSFDQATDSTARDTSPNGNDGTITAATWKSQEECMTGACLNFDGADDYVSKSYSTDVELNPGTASFTVSFWARRPQGTLAAQNTAIARFGGAGYKIYMNTSGNWCFGIDGDSTWTPTDSACTTNTYNDNRWHHIVAVKSGTSSIALYMDKENAVSDASITASSLSGSSPTFYVGIDSDGSTGEFTGQIDHVKYYNYAKTANQARAEFFSRASTKGGTTLGAPTSGQKNSLTDGLVGWWKLDESSTGAGAVTRNDSSGLGNNLTDNNTTASGNGKFLRGADFEASNNETLSITDGSQTGLDLGSTFTLAAWFRPESLSFGCTSCSGGLISKDANTGGGTERAYTLRVTGDGGSSHMLAADVAPTSTGGTSEVLSGSTALTTATWYHGAFVFDSGRVTLYLNGNIEASGTFTFSSPYNSNNAFYLGQNINDQFDGIMDDARVYNRALSTQEIRALYNWFTDPIGYWKLDDNTGTTAVDSSTNGFTTSTFTGNTAWAQGKYGSGLYFDGTDDVARVVEATATDLGSTSESYTVQAWVNTSTNFGASASIFAKNDGSGAYPFDLYLSSSEFACFQISDGTNSPSTCGSTALNDGSWHHIAGVRDTTADTIAIYVDGIRINSTADTTTATAANNDDLSIGNAGTSYTNTDFTGSIDEVRYYNYALSNIDIKRALNADHPANGSPVGSPIMHYSLDEAGSSGSTGTTINNRVETFSSISATNTGGTWLKYSSCKVNDCIFVDSTGDQIYANDPSFFDGLTQMTVSFWFYPTNLTATRSLIGKHGTNQKVFVIASDATNTDELRIQTFNTLTEANNTRYFATSNLNLVINTWYHIVVVYDGTQANADRIKVYSNGRKVSGSVTSTLSTSLLTGSTSDFTIGDEGTTTFSAALGRYDEVKVYNFALTPEDILIDMNANAAQTLGGSLFQSTTVGTADEYAALSARVGWYRMDEQASGVASSANSIKDFSLNIRQGSPTNSPTYLPCKIGNCLSFTNNGASSSYVDLGLLGSAFNADSAFTVSAWVYPTDLSDGIDDTIFCSNDSSNWCLYIDDTNDRFYLCTETSCTTTSNAYSNNSTVTANAWQHLVVTNNGSGTYAIYINGIYNCSDCTGVEDITTGSNFYIGYAAAFSSGFDGYIDDVQIFQAQASPTQVAYLFNQGEPLVNYRLDECQGTTAYNAALSANGLAYGINGTINIGATGANTAAGSCTSGTSTDMWYNGASGKYNSAMDFDGTNDDISVTNAASIDLNEGMRGGFTWSAWVYADGAGSGGIGYIFYKGANNYLRVNNLSGGRLDLEGRIDVTTDANFAWTSAIAVGEWTHVAISYTDDGDDEITLWVNGRPTTSSAVFAGSLAAESNALRIGSTSAANYFDGRIDDVRLYPYEMTAPMIGKAMREGAAVKF